MPVNTVKTDQIDVEGLPSVQLSPIIRERNKDIALAALASLDLAALQEVLQDHMARKRGPRYGAVILMNVARDLEAMPWASDRRGVK